MTALHVAAQRGRADVVRYLLAKGAKTDLLDASGRKPIDLVGTGGTPAAAAATSFVGAAAPASAAPGGPRSSGGDGVASASEIRALLEGAASPR